MSGTLAGITGFPNPFSGLPGFLGALQVASFRGVPFLVDAAQTKVGRRIAYHEYPFRDGGWPEDLGRAPRSWAFTGHLIGDLAPVMQLALDTVLELPGSGLLIHPSIGGVQAAVMSATTAINKTAGRVIEVAFVFIEDTGSVFPGAEIATVASVLALVLPSLAACGDDLGGTAGPAAALGPSVLGEGVAVVTDFISEVTLGGGDATAIVALATALAPPDSNTSYGRYADGAATLFLPAGATVATLQGQLATQRAAIASTSALAVAAARSYTPSTDMMGALSAVVEAARAGMSDPADQVRVLLNLAAFTFADQAGGTTGIGAAQAILRDAMAAACRRAALISLAQASAAYQPTSYDDAVSVRTTIAAALDGEITAAGDGGDDASYTALKQLRAAVIRDLTTRGASLPSVVTVRLTSAMPSLAIAQTLYKDASRSDQLAAEAHAIHPAFCRTVFQALSR